MSLHSFEPEIAAKVGVNAAVIYQNILFWTRKNAANGKHIHEGKVWTYNSVKALNALFEYLSPAQIRTAIGKLLDAGLIYEGNFNQIAYDRTKWYGVPCEIHLSKKANGVEQNREPIPDSNTDSNPDGKPDIGAREAHARTPKLFDPEPPKLKKARLPEDWVPTDEDVAYAFSLNLTEDDIKEIADDFHAYWTERTDAGGRKSERGWKQTWRNRVRDQAPRFIRNRRMAGGQAPNGYGQGGSIASIVARRRAEGKV